MGIVDCFIDFGLEFGYVIGMVGDVVFIGVLVVGGEVV